MPETCGRENIAPDSLHRPASSRPVAGPHTDATPVPEQAATLDLLRIGSGDTRQRGISLCGRTTATFQKAAASSWSESKSQPPDEGDLQKYGNARQLLCGTIQEFYAGLLAKGMKPEMARLTLTRKIAAITLTLWKKGGCFDAGHLKTQAA